LKKWWETLGKRNASENVIRATEVGLIVRVRIYDVTNGKEIFYGLNSLPITLDLFKKPKAIQYTLALRRDTAVNVYREERDNIHTIKRGVNSRRAGNTNRWSSCGKSTIVLCTTGEWI